MYDTKMRKCNGKIHLKVDVGVAEREEPLMYETALAGLIHPYTIHFFIGISCQVRYVSYIGLRIVVTNVVEGQG